MSARGPGPIPNRWLHCPRKSESIIAERFLAFKTPLSLAFKDQMPLDCIFTPEMIFGYIKTLKLKLGLWIDLTNTKRFYDREIVDTRGAQYVKLQCRGHGETPSREQTRSFIEIVDNFINERPFDIIAVHCTHGFNRTGFLIVSYMVERLDCSVEAALTLFSRARPPGIYKQDYINELFQRYEDGEDGVSAPELPDWCLEYDDSNGSSFCEGTAQKRKYDDMTHMSNSQQKDINSSEDHNQYEAEDDDQIEEPEAVASGSNVAATSNARPRKRGRRELVIEDAKFMDGVSCVKFVTDQNLLTELQTKVQKMCGWEKKGFPGAQPVSMDCNNISLLGKMPYRVSWKADGTRYMMLIKNRNEIYFIDRNNSCFQVSNITFVQSTNLHEHLKDTLLDGEMVLDKFEGVVTPRYLIYDILKINGKDIGQKPFYKDRLYCITKEILAPRSKAMTAKIIDRKQEPFGVRFKEFWDIWKAESLLGEKFASNLCHEPDGLIFQPSLEPYTPGACANVLKWKPFEMNSVDFLLKISRETGEGLLPQKVGYLFVGGFHGHFDKIKYTPILNEYNNKIIECKVNNRGQWEFMRERTDKVLPNSYDTAKAVIESIRRPVTKEYLLSYITNYGFRDKDLMPPPATVPKQRQPHQHHEHQQRQQQQHHHHHQQQQHHHQQQQQHHDHHQQHHDHHQQHHDHHQQHHGDHDQQQLHLHHQQQQQQHEQQSHNQSQHQQQSSLP